MPQRWDFCEVFKNEIHTCEIRKGLDVKPLSTNIEISATTVFMKEPECYRKDWREETCWLLNLHVVLLLVNVMFPSELCQ